MRDGFVDMTSWVKEIEVARPATDTLVALLQNYGAVVEPQDPRETGVGVLPYVVSFPFPGESALVTMWIIFKDHQSDSDVVITNMTVQPETERRKGLGFKAVTSLLAWVRANNLKEVRATQVSQDNEAFWMNNGFVKDEPPNPCNDFVFVVSPKP